MSFPASTTQILRLWHQEPSTFDAISWQRFYQPISPVSFTPTMLKIDEALWGGFWQGDVLAPGYLMPALELAFLRATRLDGAISLPTPEAYLYFIQTHLQQMPIAAWLTSWQAESALCLAYDIGQTKRGHFIIWLVDGLVATAYPDTVVNSPGYNLQCLKSLPKPAGNQVIRHNYTPIDLDSLSTFPQAWVAWSQTQRLDCWIRLHCSYSRLANHPEQPQIAQVLKQFTSHQ